jgi:hypothetical protein
MHTLCASANAWNKWRQNGADLAAMHSSTPGHRAIHLRISDRTQYNSHSRVFLMLLQWIIICLCFLHSIMFI